MPGITRLGDKDKIHCTDQPTRLTTNNTVFVNGLPVSLQGDPNTTHNYPDGDDCDQTHQGKIATGSSTVRVKGRGIGRIGDSLTGCTAVISGSGDVFAGD